MTIEKALQELGVQSNTLSSEEIRFLDTQGYLPLPDILTPEQIEQFRARLGELAEAEGEEAGKEVHQEQGALRLSNLINKGEFFEICVSHPRVLAAIGQVLQGDLKLSSLNSRAALPGAGLQELHVDWKGPVPPGAFQVCNSIWLLDDFTTENGATRIVPGSHLSGKVPSDVMEDRKQDHPDQIQVEAKAGTVVIFNSHTWHGGVLNRSNTPRRALHSYFCRRSNPQQLDQRKHLSQETRSRLSPAVQTILDIA